MTINISNHNSKLLKLYLGSLPKSYLCYFESLKSWTTAAVFKEF